MDKSQQKVITIDGPSGAGKGTASRGVAIAQGWEWLDSGALYRLVAYAAEQQSVNIDDELALVDVAAHLDVHFDTQSAAADEPRVMLQGNDVTYAIRHDDVSKLASKISAYPTVRAALLQRQRDFLTQSGLVADGRDMGTVVFPEAPLKIFLTASAEARAERRHKQLLAQNLDVNMPRILQEIIARDERDKNRAVSPLKPAEDALILDTTKMSIDEVKAYVLTQAEAKFGVVAS